MTASVPEFAPRNAAHWRQWLLKHHESATAVWVVTAKIGSGRRTVTYDELVEEALCFGWIDSKPRTIDADHHALYFARRKPGSGWAATNKARIERLVAEGRLHPSGAAVIERAKADGSWTLLDSSEALEVPPDLESTFADFPGSAEQFAAFPPGVRKAILQWISLAKRPETRAARITETASLAAQGIRANQWRPGGAKN